MRTGPYPLSVHLGMATSSWPVLSPARGMELHAEMTQGLTKMLQGVQMYQAHSYERTLLDLPVVYKSGTLTVGKVKAVGESTGRALVLVPSLINRSHILDLCEERSFARWISQQGINIYLLDWGEITEDPVQKDLEFLIMKRLVPALQYVAQKEGQPVAALGYCMGGTLLLGAAVHADAALDRLIMLAAPWDFHTGSQDLLTRMKFWAPSARPFIESGKALPVEGIQTLFASLDPAMAVRKFSGFADMDQNSAEARLFVATEDWLNEGVALPAAVARECIDGWFMDNVTGRGVWQVGGCTVNPARLQQEVLLVSSKRDQLVEYASAVALADSVQKAEILSPDCGHIGMIAGKHSIERVWQPIADWLKH